MPPAHAFDVLAVDYDTDFTASTLGTRMRAAVWRRLDRCFSPGQRILELGCGTGEDATHLARRGVHVVALDRSSGMVETARRKVESAGLGDRVEVHQAGIEEWAARPTAFGPLLDGPLLDGTRFDGALSNFGVLNCVEDLTPVAESLAVSLRPGGRAVLVIMGPVVPWEWLWYLLHGQPRKAFRRLRPGGVPWRGLQIHYPSIGRVRRTFAPAFRLRQTSAVGAFLPPSYVEEWAARRPRWIAGLDRLERRVEAWPPFPWLADHYLVEFERV